MIKKVLILFLLLKLFSNTLLLSQPTLEWMRLYPDTTTSFAAGSNALALDDYGNVYITGFAQSPNGSWNSFCTAKYSSAGIRQWVSNYYGNNVGGRYSYAIALDNARNVYVTGYSYEDGNDFDYCTVKYDSNGVQKWVNKYNGPSNGIDQAQKIAVDNAGNIYITGFSSLYGGWTLQNTTIKYSSDGRELWVRRYGNPDGSTYSNGLVIDDSCNVYLTGANNSMAVTVKYDSSGNEKWVRTFMGNVTGAQAKAITLDKNNNVFITGYCRNIGSVVHFDYFVVKYSSSGVQQWYRTYNTDSTNYASYYTSQSVVVDNNSNVYISGDFLKDQASAMKLCTIKYSNLGNLLWVKKDTAILGTGYVYMDIDKDDNIFIACDSGASSYVTIKYDSSGFMKWRIRQYTGSSPYDLKVGKNSDIYLTGGSGKMRTIKYSQITGIISISSKLPIDFKLYQNFPNPFNPTTTIKFDVSSVVSCKKSVVRIDVFDVTGKLIANLVNELLSPGSYKVDWDGTNYSSGIYFYRILIEDFTETKKMILLK